VSAERSEIFRYTLALSSLDLSFECLSFFSLLSLLSPCLVLCLFLNDIVDFLGSGSILCKGLDLLADELGLNRKGLQFLAVEVHVFIII
jgi:hypothetical protein